MKLEEKALRIESPPSEWHPWTTATLESRSFAVIGPPQLSLLFPYNSGPPRFQGGLLQFAASAIASCVNGLPLVTSKSSDEERENCLAPVECTSRDLPLSQTDKCKISIMIVQD